MTFINPLIPTHSIKIDLPNLYPFNKPLEGEWLPQFKIFAKCPEKVRILAKKIKYVGTPLQDTLGIKEASVIQKQDFQTQATAI